jgi:hypothetical protein
MVMVEENTNRYVLTGEKVAASNAFATLGRHARHIHTNSRAKAIVNSRAKAIACRVCIRKHYQALFGFNFN